MHQPNFGKRIDRKTMQNADPKVLFTEADQLLHAADGELKRAMEDVVTHLICRNSRQSIINYLQGFLIEKGITPTAPVTAENLLEQCMSIDPRFEELNISAIPCRSEEFGIDYCMDLERVEECYDVARKTELLVKV